MDTAAYGRVRAWCKKHETELHNWMDDIMGYGGHSVGYYIDIAELVQRSKIEIPDRIREGLKHNILARFRCTVHHERRGDADESHDYALKVLEDIRDVLDGGVRSRISSSPPPEKERDLSGPWRRNRNSILPSPNEPRSKSCPIDITHRRRGLQQSDGEGTKYVNPRRRALTEGGSEKVVMDWRSDRSPSWRSNWRSNWRQL